jgi:uroporphyrin-III C-methyltransferase
VTFEITLVFAELKDLREKNASTGLESPTLLIIGKVVELSPFWPIPTKQESYLMSLLSYNKSDSWKVIRVRKYGL